MNTSQYLLMPLYLFLCSCSVSGHLADGWYPVTTHPDYKIEGNAIVSTSDFAIISLDTTSIPNEAFIEGQLKPDKIKIWEEATEDRIGKCIGFVFNDSVIMAPKVNNRIESGRFTINSHDKRLILEIYKSINKKTDVHRSGHTNPES